MNATIFNHPSFSDSFRNWIQTAPMDDIWQSYSDNYKEFYGCRPSMFHHEAEMTREEYAHAFVRLGEQFKAQEEHEAWHNDERNQPFVVPEPEPLPYEEYDV